MALYTELTLCYSYCIVQQDLSAFGVQPTCSVSMINSGPATPFVPEVEQKARTQYVIPGLRSPASTLTVLCPDLAETVVDPATFVQSCSTSFHCISYVSIDDTGLNCIAIVVC